MNKEFFEALDLIEKEKGIPKEYILEKVEAHRRTKEVTHRWLC